MKLTTPTSKMKKSKSKTAGDEDDEQEEEDQATVAPPDISERGEFGEDDDKKTRCVKGFCTLVKWLGLITGMLTLVLWAIHVYDKKVSASLPVGDADFFEDINLSSWRNTLFSFNPDVFVDAWTPFIMGLMAILMHFEKFHMPVFTAGWFRFCVWNLTLALFGDLGYSGIAGLIVGAFALLTSFLSFLLFFLHTGPAHLFDVSERYISTSRVRESPLLRLATSRRLQDEGGEGERGTFRSGVITLKSSFWRRDKTLSPEQNNTDGGAGEEGEDESDDQKKKETTQKKETLKKMNSSSFLSDDKKDEGDEKTKEEEGTKENREMKGIKEEEENPDDKDDVDGESSGQRGAGAGGGGE